MNIAQVAPLQFTVPPQDHGGTERMVADLTDALVARGHTVTLFAAEGSQTQAQLQPQGPCVSSIGDAPPSMPSAVECCMLDRVAQQADAFDVIHCHTELYHAAVLRTHRHKCLMTIHWRADQMDRQVYFDHFNDQQVAAISRSQAATLPEANCIGTVHHGIPEDRYSLGDGTGGYCAFLGRLTDQKRPDRAIEIAERAGLPIRLGGTRDVGNPTYFERAIQPRLSAKATYIGPVTEADKQDFLGNAAVFLFPVDWPEPFGLVMIEAMACGTPVVAWRNGSTSEIIDDGVTGYVVDTMEAAVEAVGKAQLLDRKAIRDAFEHRFTAGRMAADYENLYARMVARS